GRGHAAALRPAARDRLGGRLPGRRGGPLHQRAGDPRGRRVAVLARLSAGSPCCGTWVMTPTNGITSRLRRRVGATRRPAQHFAVLRFLPTAPFLWTFSMYSGAYGTLHDVSPTSTDTSPIFWAVCRARSVSGCT